MPDKHFALTWVNFYILFLFHLCHFKQDDEPPYQDVLESKYLNDRTQLCWFETANFEQYVIDFVEMKQTNLRTCFKRDVRRRPADKSNNDRMLVVLQVFVSFMNVFTVQYNHVASNLSADFKMCMFFSSIFYCKILCQTIFSRPEQIADQR